MPVIVPGFVDFALGSVTDENGLSTPLDDDLPNNNIIRIQYSRKFGKRTFLPSGIAPRPTSTLAWARTSADADMLTRKSIR